MKKINFENLPSTNTPINAANLNQIQSNVEEVFNGAETMGNVIVEDIKCKNIFSSSLNTGYWKPDGTIEETSSVIRTQGYIEVEPNTTYAFSSEDDSISSFVGNLLFWDENKTFISQIYNFNTFTTPENCYFITFHGTNTIYDLSAKIQLEKGSVITGYTNYKKYDLNTYEITVTIQNGNTYQNDLLKSARFIVVNWMPSDESWSMQTLHVQKGYSLNTYGSYSVGSVFDPNEGTIKYNYSTDGNMKITKILIIK